MFIGHSTESIREKVLAKSGVDLTPNLLHQLHLNIFSAFEEKLISLLENVLKHCYTKKIDYCIASNSKVNWITHALRVTDHLKYFTDKTIFSASQLQYAKPAPDLFLFAAKQMGYSPKDCIVIEDSTAGIEAAIAAKMTVIGFLGGGHAQYSWYQDRIKTYDIPIAKNETELCKLLQFDIE
jgi:HAD superfamily hydrolase (TIGR01509 family)